MHTNSELKNLKTDIINICDRVMSSLDIIEINIKSHNCRALNIKVQVLEKVILNTLSKFENFIILLTENEDFETVLRKLTYIKSLLSILRCCINSDKKDFDKIGICLICDLIYDECEKAIELIQKIV